jgi:membrane-bound lytic murein transglycosylase D
MRPQLAALGPLLAAVVACQSTTPSPQTTIAGSRVSARQATASCDGVREEVDLLLEEAQDAAVAGRADDAQACETAVFAELARCGPEALRDPEQAAYLAQVLGDLALIDDSAQSAEGEEQVAGGADTELPEPEPVSADQVVAEQEKAREAAYDLPVVVNAEVTSLIEFYSGSYRERFAAAMERAGRYLPYIREELRKAKMPLDLAYLPFVESAFNPSARSRARAQGLWQFIAGTARLYDLHCDRMVDERNDPYLATRAAVAHLAELDAMFGRWELALAAYNSGPGRVQQALRRAHGRTDDFWELRRYLPRETRNYVPALWAVLVIVKNPAAYGFAPIVEAPECIGRIRVDGALDLDVLADRAGVDAAVLAEINPALIHGSTPVGSSYQLAVPCGQEQRYTTVLAAIPSSQRVRSFMHVIERGDTLASIARRYGSTAETIAAANGVRNPRSLRIGQTLVIPRQAGAYRALSSSRRTVVASAEHVASRPAKPRATADPPDRYRVRSGDSLYSIARRFGISVDRLQSLNGLTGTLIHPGQWLRL